MKRKSQSTSARVTRRSFNAGLGAAAARRHRAVQHRARRRRPLKVGVLLPRSGVQAGIGQDC